MSLQYALPLTRSERQFLTRIAQGRGGAPRPTVWQVVRARARLKCDIGGEAHLLQRAQSAPPVGYARWTLRLLARELAARGVGPRISYETVRRTLKKRTTPWRRVPRGYPTVPEEEFVASMEKGLDLYSQPYAARYPVIGRDEHAQLLRAATRPPCPARPGHPATYDYAYVRHGPCAVWLFVEPLGPWRTAHATARRTAVDWAHPVRALVNHPRYRQAECLIRVCDHLNTHAYASFLRAFPPAEAQRLAPRVHLVFTSRHGRSTGPNRN